MSLMCKPESGSCRQENIQILSELIKNHLKNANKNHDNTDKIAEQFLTFRKDNVPRAFESFKLNYKLREDLKLDNIDPLQSNIKKELLSEKFSVIQSDGKTLAIFTVKHHLPSIVDESTIIKGILYQIDAAIKDENISNNGLIIIYNMIGSKYTNFDYEMTLRLLNIFMGAYPLKIKKILILCPPFWFRAPYKVMRLFVREKMRDRTFLVDISTLVKNVPSSILPKYLGGKFEHSHSDWLRVCFERNGVNITEEYFQENLNMKSTDEQCPEYLRVLDKTSNDTCYGKVQKNSKSYTLSRRSTVQFKNENTWSEILNRHKSLMGNDRYMTISDRKKGSSDTSDIKNAPSTGTLQRRVSSMMGTSVIYPDKSDISNMTELTSSPTVSSSISSASLTNQISQTNISRKRPTSGTVLSSRPIVNSDATKEVISSKKNTKFNSEFDVSTSDSKTKITIGEFVKRVNKLGDSGLTQEFDLLFRSDPFSGSAKNFKLSENRHLNRYRDVPCIDNTIVQLSNKQYIHANWVHGYDRPYNYIFTQGPLDETVDHFWQMIWETNSGVIVMLTKVIEGNRIKCSQYWPSEMAYNSYTELQKAKSLMTRKHVKSDLKTSSLDCLRVVSNNFEVALISEKFNEKEKVFCSTLRLTNLQKPKEDPMELTHLLYVAWPDFDVPSETESFKSFVGLVNSLNERHQLMYSSLINEPKKLPIVVHCSAGIGRTGTFAAVDINLKMAKSISQIDVPGVVAKLRKQRALTVQVAKQYVFIHQVLLSFINDM